ncbi:MAG: DUF2786 domain-containing protein [Sporichthyaceae bacterium]
MEDKLERIRKILAKAEHPSCPPHEAEALNEKAAFLIAKYGVDMALLAEAMPESSRVVGDRVIPIHPPYARDKCNLLATVAIALRCRCVQKRQPALEGGTEWSLHLFGHAADLDRAELLYTSLLVQAAAGIAREAAAAPWGEDLRAFRRSWLAGFAAAVGRRLREAEDRAEAEAAQSAPACSDGNGRSGASVALVLADRTAEVEEALRERYPGLAAGRPRHLSGSGFRRGAASGAQANLGLRADLRGAGRRQLGA